ncbi:putative Ulp1 protease family catalytic domain, papain-like cysteine peptidase superfamily [Arabidopsis thaliana]
MASSSHTRSYPLRLYEEGKSPLQKRSMAHSCYVSQIGKIKDGLGADVGFIWAAQTVHFFLTNQLRVDNMHEMWCLIDRRPIRFSLYEFENITGLNCDMFDEFTLLERVFEISKTWSLEKRMMVGRLCLLSVGVHEIHYGSRVPLSSAKRVLDPVAFEKYPWGRVAFDSLLRSVKIVKYDGDSYVIHGCVQTLLVWIYESVPGIGEACGFRKTNLTGVPLLDWRSSRKRFNFTAFIEKEKAAHGQVRVRHMIPVSEENMYPQWSDSTENHDTALDNLLKDIIHNRLQPHAWTHVAARCKRKQNQESSNEDGESKVMESTPADDVSHKKQRTGKAHIKVDEEEKTSLLDIWNMLEKMNVTISDMDKNASSRLDGLEKKVTCLEASVKTRFKAVETDMRVLKESQPPVVSNEAATSNNNDEYEANSNQCSWLVEEKPGSVDGLPIQRVVKKTVNSVKNKEVATKVLTKKKVAKSYKKKTIVNVEKVDSPKPLQKKSVAAPTTKTFDDDVVDVTDKVNADNLKMASSSEETFSNPIDQMANKATADALRALQEGLDNLDGITSKRRRATASGEKEGLNTSNFNARFYWQIMTPRSDWPTEKYRWLKDYVSIATFKFFCFQLIKSFTVGWLKVYVTLIIVVLIIMQHMGAAMSLFRRRFNRDPSKYPNQRIAFLDQDLISTMLKDYKQFQPDYRCFKFREYYEDQKWFVDVDHLYAYLFVNENHWVALDIDLTKKRVNVYDSIPSLTTDTEMAIQCINVGGATESWSGRRITKISENLDPGDCAIYSIKYIECLALGKSFDGLCDENMQSLLTKLAVEMFEELGENAGTLHSEVRRKAFKFPSLMDE